MKTFHKHFLSPALGLFIIRLVAGTIFLYHGISKLAHMESAIAYFAAFGFGSLLVWIVALVQTLGGVALIVGYFSRFFSALLVIITIISLFTIEKSLGFAFVESNLLLLATLIAVIFSGCGRYSICRWKHQDHCDQDCGCHHDA